MAIIPTLPGYQVEIIKTTNEPFPEHPDNGENEWPREYETPHKALQFVECVSGAPFQIHLQLRSKVNFKGSSILIKVVIAGMTVAALQVNRKHFGKNGEYSTDCKGAYSRSSPTQTELRPFIFTELEKVDDGDARRVASDVDLAKGLGDITVEFHHVNIIVMPSKSDSKSSFKVPKCVTQIAEKALKGQAVSHSVGYGGAQVYSQEMLHIDKIHYLDGRDQPFGVFLFKYRSREALQSELIIPRSPTPEIEPDINRRETALTRLARLQQEMDQIKLEIKDEDPDLVWRKRGLDDDEYLNSGRAKRLSKKRVERTVVDLTDD